MTPPPQTLTVSSDTPDTLVVDRDIDPLPRRAARPPCHSSGPRSDSFPHRPLTPPNGNIGPTRTPTPSVPLDLLVDDDRSPTTTESRSGFGGLEDGDDDSRRIGQGDHRAVRKKEFVLPTRPDPVSPGGCRRDTLRSGDVSRVGLSWHPQTTGREGSGEQSHFAEEDRRVRVWNHSRNSRGRNSRI